MRAKNPTIKHEFVGQRIPIENCSWKVGSRPPKIAKLHANKKQAIEGNAKRANTKNVDFWDLDELD
jgi:hypothetical protein